MGAKEIIVAYMGKGLDKIFLAVPAKFFEKVEEIRLRVNKPLMLYSENVEYLLDPGGQFTRDMQKAYKPTSADIQGSLALISDYSLYAFEEELKMGYITLPGGHRVGLTGRVAAEGGAIRTIKNINGLTIRISHEIKGCALKLMEHVALPQPMHTMIISPPACGKTTLLRDIVRLLSTGITNKSPGWTVGIVDERSEIAGCYQGVPQNDVGPRSDVLDGCPKAAGMKLLLRAMSPRIIAVDEIGSQEDACAIEDIVNAGVVLFCTVHGKDLADIRRKPVLGALVGKNIFQRYVVLDRPGHVEGIYDNVFQLVIAS